MTAATSRAEGKAAPVAKQKIAWGAVSNDLQLGVRFDAKARNYQRGETVKFDLVTRNVGKKAVKFSYLSPTFPRPFVTDEKGKTRETLLKSPPPLGYPVGDATLALASGAQRKIEKTELRIGAPAKQTLFWALDAAPGKYRVGFKVTLQSLSDQINQMKQKPGRAPLTLKSGFLALVIAPIPKGTSATAPKKGAEFAAQLPLGALVQKDYRDSVLAVEPSVYRVSYSYVFDPQTVLSSRVSGLKKPVQFERDKPERARPKYKYNLTSGEVWLKVAPARPDKS